MHFDYSYTSVAQCDKREKIPLHKESIIQAGSIFPPQRPQWVCYRAGNRHTQKVEPSERHASE